MVAATGAFVMSYFNSSRGGENCGLDLVGESVVNEEVVLKRKRI